MSTQTYQITWKMTRKRAGTTRSSEPTAQRLRNTIIPGIFRQRYFFLLPLSTRTSFSIRKCLEHNFFVPSKERKAFLCRVTEAFADPVTSVSAIAPTTRLIVFLFGLLLHRLGAIFFLYCHLGYSNVECDIEKVGNPGLGVYE